MTNGLQYDEDIPIEGIHLEVRRLGLKSAVHDLQLAAIEITSRYLPSLLVLKGRCVQSLSENMFTQMEITAPIKHSPWNSFRTKYKVCCSTSRPITPMGFDLYLLSNKYALAIPMHCDLTEL